MPIQLNLLFSVLCIKLSFRFNISHIFVFPILSLLFTVRNLISQLTPAVGLNVLLSSSLLRYQNSDPLAYIAADVTKESCSHILTNIIKQENGLLLNLPAHVKPIRL